VQRLHELSALFLTLAREAGLDTGDSEGTPVIPCVVGSSVTALKLSNALLRCGVNANPILDAIHLAAALTAPDLRAIVTYDSRLAGAAADAGIAVVSPWASRLA
jgi:7-keto-8-aminopelargonate synthetase-like enzyme